MLGFFQDQVLSAVLQRAWEGGLGTDVTLRKAVDVAEPKIAGAFPGSTDRRGIGPIGAG